MPSPAQVEQMVESVRGLAVKVAKEVHKKHNGTYDLEDLIQAALLGAAISAAHYDEHHDSEASFATYAIHRMRREARKLYRKAAIVYIPQREYTEMPKIDRWKYVFGLIYTSTPVTEGSSNFKEPITVEGFLEAPPEPDDLFKFTVQKLVRKFLSKLLPIERDLIEKVYGFQGEPMTIVDAAAMHGLSRQRGWQRVHEGLAKIEKMCKREGVGPAWLDS